MKRHFKILAILLLLAITIFSLWHIDIISIINAIRSGDIKTTADIIAQAGVSAILISILINVAISIMGVIPSVFLTGANILVFGLYGGFLVSWAGEVIGAAVSFMFYRWGVQSVAKISTDQWKLSKTVSSLPGVKQIYFLTVLRLAPFVPSGLINLFGAITTVSLLNFLIATAVGKFPALILETAFSYNVITLGKNYVYLIISIIIAILLYFGVKKELDRLEKHHK